MNNKAISETAKDNANVEDTNEMLKKILDVLTTSNKSQEIVRAVFYAVVASVWGSVICTILHGEPDIFKSWKTIWDFYYNHGPHNVILMCLAVFAFISLYFHDEWKCGERGNYPKEDVTIICFGWSFFLLQVCLLIISTVLSAVCGVIGVGIITYGLSKNKKTNPDVKIKRFVIENVIWMVALIIHAVGTSVGFFGDVMLFWDVFLVAPIIFILFRMLCSWELPK